MLKKATILIPTDLNKNGIIYSKDNTFHLNISEDFGYLGYHVNIIDENNNIISSTNKDLNLPSPSLNFLTRLIKNLNQEGEESITEILVEYTSEEKVRIKPDNTITIKKLNTYWERIELESLFQAFANKFVANIEEAKVQMEVSDWVTRNLI
jgi:hypothetical protein